MSGYVYAEDNDAARGKEALVENGAGRFHHALHCEHVVALEVCIRMYVSKTIN